MPNQLSRYGPWVVVYSTTCILGLQSGQELERCHTLIGHNARDFAAPKLDHKETGMEEFDIENGTFTE